jgi:DNA-binding GntR family transcriptional regulator
VRALLERIVSGELKPGGPVPSKAVLAREYAVSPSTVMQAFRSLRERGVIRRVPGVGYFVCTSFTYVPGEAPQLGPADPGGLAARGDPVTGRLEHFGEPGDPRDWVRVANTLIDRIEAGQYADGLLPGRDVIAAELGVNPTRTVQRAFGELCKRGVIGWAPGRGHYVTGTPDPRAWVRVMNGLLDQIAGGELKPGDRVPVVDALLARYGCGRDRHPVTKAFTALERRGVIRRIRGNRYEVMAGVALSPEEIAAREQLTEALRWAWDGAYKIGSSPRGGLEAWRMDGSGTLHADTPEELRDLVRGDYGLRPVAVP